MSDVKALLVGKRASVLAELGDALTARGHDVVIGAQASASVVGDQRFDIVSFGRAIDDAVRRSVMDAARSRNPRAQRVDGLAPVTDLLVVQCEWAGRRATGETDGDPAVLVEAVPQPRVVVRRVGGTADVEVMRHRLTPWFSSRSEPIPIEVDGSDAFAWFDRRPSASRDFVSVRIDGAAVFVGDSLGRLPLCQ
jgi:hypothetical protein